MLTEQKAIDFFTNDVNLAKINAEDDHNTRLLGWLGGYLIARMDFGFGILFAAHQAAIPTANTKSSTAEGTVTLALVLVALFPAKVPKGSV